MPLTSSAINRLRRDIAQLESTARHGAPVTTGLLIVDSALPWGGLPTAALHEIAGTLGDGAALGFATAVATAAQQRSAGAVLWCRQQTETFERGVPYLPGLTVWGLTPDRIVFVDSRKPIETLWAMEEGLRAGAFVAVIGDGVVPDFTAARRLQLAASSGPAIALILRPSRTSAVSTSSPALTRWRITAQPIAHGNQTLIGRTWRVDLLHCRGAAPRSWMVNLNDAEAPLSGAVVTPLADGSLAA